MTVVFERLAIAFFIFMCTASLAGLYFMSGLRAEIMHNREITISRTMDRYTAQDAEYDLSLVDKRMNALEKRLISCEEKISK